MARIVLGISGGIAAYKALGLIRPLITRGHRVDVIPTASALRFVGRPTLEALSRNPVTEDLFDDVAEVRHVALGQRADLILIAPATANTMAKLVTGLADSLLLTTVLASRAPLMLAPAMHPEMWEHPATRANAATLLERGVTLIGPGDGPLTGDDSGVGRMSEVEEILAAVDRALPAAGERSAPEPAQPAAGHDHGHGSGHGLGPLVGKRVLVTAGGTREPLDPVRYLGNRSSGRQGVALAAAAAGMGAQVTVIGCNVAEGVTGGLPAGVRLLPVSTTAELGAALDAEAGTADLVLMAAAVADYRPETVSDGKIKKTAGADDLVLRLVQNPDLLRGLVAQRPEGQRIVGFAAETATDARELLELGRRKAAAKGADALVLNEVGWALGMDQPDNRVTLLSAEGAILGLADGTKDEVASAILRFLLSAWDDLSA